ncbi:MAG: phosphatidylserine decarboxylase [Rhodospirillaceae bacterium]|nr:phosphatidylserine decarboxylase [Rhodospirillaceae bacterium]
MSYITANHEESEVKSASISWRTYLLPPLHPEGPGFVGIFALVTLVLWWIADLLGLVGLGATVWCFYFFRDPDRITPTRDGLVISPADGIVQMIVEAAPPPELQMDPTPRTRISVFMSVFDCHVNRAPIAGTVVREDYTPGKFLNATLDKASEDNERQAVLIKTDSGKEFAVVQIAGLVARRIRCDVRKDQNVVTGQRIGMIRFGSRVDVYLPAGVHPLVAIGQHAVAGETVLADITSSESQRSGEAR